VSRRDFLSTSSPAWYRIRAEGSVLPPEVTESLGRKALTSSANVIRSRTRYSILESRRDLIIVRTPGQVRCRINAITAPATDLDVLDLTDAFLAGVLVRRDRSRRTGVTTLQASLHVGLHRLAALSLSLGYVTTISLLSWRPSCWPPPNAGRVTASDAAETPLAEELCVDCLSRLVRRDNHCVTGEQATVVEEGVGTQILVDPDGQKPELADERVLIDRRSFCSVLVVNGKQLAGGVGRDSVET
jgi:hypothetical protein